MVHHTQHVKLSCIKHVQNKNSNTVSLISNSVAHCSLCPGSNMLTNNLEFVCKNLNSPQMTTGCNFRVYV